MKPHLALRSRSLPAALLIGGACALLAPGAHAGLFDLAVDLAKGKVSAEKATPYNFAAPPAAQSAQYVESVRTSNIKDVKKVGIVNFTVEFALYKSAQASGGGYRNPTTGEVQTRSISVEKAIPPPDVAALQALTDRLYQSVQADLRQMGIEVVPFDVLKATPNFAGLAPAQHASPWLTDTKDTQSVFMAPSAMPLYMDNPARADFLQGLGMSFGTNTRMKEVMMTYDLKQEVHLLSVNMVVDFATVQSSGNSFSAYGARASGANVHHLHAGNTSYRFISTTQPELLYVKLKQPLVSDQSLWSQQSATTTKDTSVTGATTATSTATETVGEFDSATYLKRSEDMLNAARQMFALELAKAR